MKAKVIRITVRCLAVTSLLAVAACFTQPAAAQSTGSRYAPDPPVSSAPPLELAPDQNVAPVPVPQVVQVGFVESESSSTATITQSDIDTKIKEVTDDTSLDEATKKEALERLKSATEWLKTAKEAAEKPLKFQADIEAAPNDLRDAKHFLALPRGEPTFNVSEATPLVEIEQAAAEAEAKLKLAKETLVKKEETIKRRSERKAELTKLVPETEKAYEEAKKALTTARDNASLLDAAKRREAEAKFLALEQQRTLFPLETKRLDAVAELTPLQRDVMKREVEFVEKEAVGWQKILADARKRDSNRQAAEAKRQLQQADPALKSLAERNAELAEQRKALVTLIATTVREVQQANLAAADIKLEFGKMEEKVKRAGNSTTIGLLLRRRRDQLPELNACHERLRFVENETPAIHLSLLDLQDERELLDDRDAIVADALKRLEKTDRQYDDAYFAQMVGELLTSKVDLLNTLIRDHDEYIKQLGELEVAQNELVTRTEESQVFIDERVLWIRSSDPIGLAHFGQAWAELQDLSRPAEWAAVSVAIKNRIVQRPLLAVLAILAVFLMILCRDRFRRQIDRICESEPEELRGHFLPTIEAIVAASLATAFWPGLMWLVGWQLRTTHAIPDLGAAVGWGLQSAAYAFWLCRFARQLCRRNGIAERHFEWNAQRVGIARRNLSWLSAIGIPCVFFISAVTVYRDGEWSSFLGRTGFLVGMATLIVFAHSTLRVRRSIVRDVGSEPRSVWYYQMRHAVYFLGIGIPVGLATLTALGYDYSAQHLALRLQATASVVFAVILGQAIALRWLAVRKFRLEAVAADAAAEELAASEGQIAGAESGGERVPVEDNNDSDLRYLLRYAVAAALLVGGYFVWSDVTPALGILDKVELSSKSVEVKQSVANDDGTTKVITSHEEVKTTLKHAVLACLLLALGLLVARNLPALVDVLVLERMPIDKGQRYAAGMILRYLLTLATMAMACLTIGLSWSSIQWLAAAMTVGLGFGLQEIFANLVSGLIILFERPIRVGDLVTVGGVSGRVTRMQIRATTITGFDRRELIVPNKKFITEDVMNWTLTDNVNRVEIQVGVAYGSDTKLAREILLKIARRNPFVLTDPEPLATFDRFADSSLNFTLRCFLPDLDNRLAVINDLHMEIDREFRQANIEIAFPQQDLHVRTIDVPIRKLLRGEQGQKDAA